MTESKQTKSRARTRTPSRRGRPLGCLIWLIPLALGVIVLLANPKVMRDIQEFLTTPRKTADDKKTEALHGVTAQETAQETAQDIPAAHTDEILPTPDTSALLAIIAQDMREQENKLREILDTERQNANPPREADAGISVRIFFIHYDAAADQLFLQPVTRNLGRQDTPALAALRALLEGPSEGELRAGYRTLLPKNLQVRRMRVENGVLFIDLSRDFLYNHTLGQEGLILQIYQIVNSMTDFPTVRAVRFLIEGQSHATIGGDGVPFDRPFYHNVRPLAK